MEMAAKAEDQASESPIDSTVVSKLIRSTVINNSQIIMAPLRAGLILIVPAAFLGMWLRSASPGIWRETLRIVVIAAYVVSASLMIVSQFLGRALRRCPVCRTRITRKTEEKRRCLECDTELWGYWDE
jgi:hypothetical protein